MEKEVLDPNSPHVIQGTNSVVWWATNIADGIHEKRGCGIAIANETRFNLVDSTTYLFSGKIAQMAAAIPAHHTGLVKCVKTWFSLRGSVGVATYRLQDHAGILPIAAYHLQVMWHVPYDGVTYSNYVNVRLGTEQASYELFHKLYYAGQPMLASDNVNAFHLFDLDQQFQAKVQMNNSAKPYLAVTFKSKPDDDRRQGHQKF